MSAESSPLQWFPGQTRREFCARACQAASLLAAGALLPACGSPTTPTTTAPTLSVVAGAVVDRTVTVAIETSGPLAAVGDAAELSTSLGTFLVARTAQSSFNVLTAICTHAACTVTGFESSQFVCPCHGSRYSLSGAVVNGPATQPLQQFASVFANNTLTFNA